MNKLSILIKYFIIFIVVVIVIIVFLNFIQAKQEENWNLKSKGFEEQLHFSIMKMHQD